MSFLGTMQQPAESATSIDRVKSDREKGKSGRKLVARASHAHWRLNRNFDSHSILDQTRDHRLKQLIPIRFGRMLKSPLDFLRGEPLIMARDLAATPRSGLAVQCCGDAHLMNFGLFGSPERNLLFDLNDFDETLQGPWEWDLKRLAASFVVAGRQRGMAAADCFDCARLCLQSYRERIRRYSKKTPLQVWYYSVQGKELRRLFQKRGDDYISRRIDAAEKRDQQQAVAKLTIDSERPRFEDRPPVIQHTDDLLPPEKLGSILRTYRETLSEDRRQLFDRYEVVDHVLKVVGVASVGTRCFAVLLTAGNRHRDRLILQLKEATPSALEGLAGCSWKANQGQRTVIGQRVIQGFTDIFLGWGSDGERDYYIRQLRDLKSGIDPCRCSAEELKDYAELCGWVLARAHARSGNPAFIAGYLGKTEVFDEAVAHFAIQYADQVERDFEKFKLAVGAGRFPVEVGI